MKSKYLVFGMLVFLFSSCQNSNNDSTVVSTRFVHKYGFNVSEKEWVERGKDGKIITTLKNGITKISSYKNGVLDGKTTISYPLSTAIQEFQEYSDGILTKKVFYEPSGLPIEETLFHDNGKTITIWNKQGVPLSIETYENNLLWSAEYFNFKNEVEASIKQGEGMRVKRNRDNLLLSKEKIENGKMISRTAFHPNGNIQSKSAFVDYQLHGIQETFSPTGNLLTKFHWVHGNLDGMQIGYRNGNKYFEVPYIDGKKHGLERHFDPHGALVKEINWENNLRHGRSRLKNGDYSDIQWYWKGVAVDLKKFQSLKFREELIADLNENNPPQIKE